MRLLRILLLTSGVLVASPSVTAAQQQGAPEPDVFASEELLQLEGILISDEAVPPPPAGSSYTIDQTELETFERDDPHRVLLTVPGVYVRQEDGYGLRPNIGLRGANSERSQNITLMEDGVLLAPAPYAAPAAYYFPLMTRMVEVEVIKGPSTIRYGPHTVGGAIDMRTRSVPLEPQGGIDAAGGSFGYGKAHLHYGVGNERAGLLLEGIHVRSNGFKELDGGGNTGFGRSELMLKGELRTEPGAPIAQSALMKLGFSSEASNETYLGLSDADFRKNPFRRYRASALDRMRWHRTLVELHHRLDFKNFNLETTAYRHDFARTWLRLNRFAEGPPLNDILATPTSGRRAVFFAVLTGEQDSSSDAEFLRLINNSRTFVSQGIQSTGTLKLDQGALSHSAELGLRLHYDSVERDHDEESFAMRSGNLTDAGLPSIPVDDNRGEALAFAAYLRYSLSIGPLTVTPGLRTELIQTWFEDRLANRETDAFDYVVLPGAGLHYAFTSELGAFLGVHRGFRPVSPGQPAQVKPETSVNYEAGGRYTTERTKLELIGFFNDYSNLTSQCSFSEGCMTDSTSRQFNAGAVHVYGLEVLGHYSHELGNGWLLPLHATYTYTDSSFRSTFESDFPQFGDVNKGDQLPYIPLHQATFGAGIGADRWSVDLSSIYVGRMREQAGQGSPPSDERTDRYLTFDAVGTVRLLQNTEAYLKLENFTAREALVSRRPFGARPLRPLSVQLGLKATL